MATTERYPHMKTLNELLAEHPEYGDVPVGVYTGAGVDHNPLIYLSQPDEEEIADFEDNDYAGPTLVFNGD